MDNSIQRGERLYLDCTESGGRYITFNCDLIPVISSLNLSSEEMLLFLDICFQYDSERQQPYKISYQKMADRHTFSKNGVINALETLKSKQLIQVINESERKGRAAKEYTPNVKYLHKLLKDYVKKGKKL